MSEWMIKVTHMKVSVEMKAKEVGHSKSSVHSHNAIIQRKKQETNLHCLGQILNQWSIWALQSWIEVLISAFIQNRQKGLN